MTRPTLRALEDIYQDITAGDGGVQSLMQAESLTLKQPPRLAGVAGPNRAFAVTAWLAVAAAAILLCAAALQLFLHAGDWFPLFGVTPVLFAGLAVTTDTVRPVADRLVELWESLIFD